MWKLNLLVHLQFVASADRDRRRCPFADAIHCQYRRALEWRRKKCACRVAEMMLRKQQALVPVDQRCGSDSSKLSDEHGLLKQLLGQPQRKGRRKAREPARRERHVGLEQPIEFEERLLIEDDVIKSGGSNVTLLEAIAQRIPGKTGIVFDAAESLFLCGGHDLAVAHESRGAVVIVGRQP